MATFDSDREGARDALLVPLQRAVSCISRAVLVRGNPSTGAVGSWTFEDRYGALQGRYRLEFSMLHTYEVRYGFEERGSWKATTVAYFYQVRERSRPEIIAFHWHPGRHGQPNFPHLHVASHVGTVQIAAKSHVPTGRVPLEAVVRFLISELHVRPVRADWEQVLDEGERLFNARRSW